MEAVRAGDATVVHGATGGTPRRSPRFIRHIDRQPSSTAVDLAKSADYPLPSSPTLHQTLAAPESNWMAKKIESSQSANYHRCEAEPDGATPIADGGPQFADSASFQTASRTVCHLMAGDASNKLAKLSGARPSPPNDLDSVQPRVTESVPCPPAVTRLPKGLRS